MDEAPHGTGQAADGLGQLKSLLFQGESRRLEAVERAVDYLDHRVGDAPGLERATAEIIVEALRDAEVARHRELADAIAPVVVAAIRNEIRNSREMMVEALYPLTGQMVAAAVRNAVREAVEAINQRLDALTSVDRWKLRMRSRLTGRPVGELALAGVRQGRLVRILYLESASGRVIANWRAGADVDENADLVAGLIAAITGFAREALDAGANELRTLDLGGRRIYLRNSPRTIAAAEVEGELTREQAAALESAFLALVEDYSGDDLVEVDALAGFAARVNAATAPAEKRSGSGLPLKIITALLALTLCAFSWRAGARWWRERAVETTLAAVVAERPWLKAWPLAARVDHSAGRVEISGLAPSQADARAIVEALGTPAGPYAVAGDIAVVATAAGIAALDTRAEATAREIEAARREISALTGRAAALEARLSAAADNQDALARRAASADQVADLQSRLEGLARAGATSTQLAALRERIEAVAAAGAPASLADDLRDLERKLGDARSRIDALGETAGETRRLDAGIRAQAERLDGVVARLDAPRARLARLVEGFAIFFADREKPVDESSAAARLDAIATLLKSDSLGIRVVGHTDASGSPAQNVAISRRRAEIVADMLEARGVDRRQLVVVARAASFPIAEPDPATRERNRRVTLETLFDNEATP